MEKQEILENIENDLNQENLPWKIAIEGDSIIATWKWMDATFFSPGQIDDEIKEYKFIVTLLDNSKWSEKDISIAKNIGIDEKGVSFGKTYSVGHQYEKTYTIGFGKDKNTDKFGIISSKFDTNDIKKSIREYLQKCGWKKKGFFG